MANINEAMMALGKVRSVIRETFEYGNKRAAEIGRENVFDFSLGNPSIPAPDEVDGAILDLVKNTDSVALHGYTSAPGAPDVRRAIAEDLNTRFGTSLSAGDIYMTCGAAASLTVSIHALVCPGDEFLTVSPFFPEYRVFVESAGAKLVPVPAKKTDFSVDPDAVQSALNENTKAIILNSPNNPTGAIFKAADIRAVCDILREAEKKYGHPIWLISDEPYRELVYDDVEVPYLVNEYDDTLVCYSFSKSMSLPGERIGYIAVSPKAAGHDDIYAAICGAGRALGFVCAPSMMQRVVARALGKTSDVSAYRVNRDLLCGALASFGFEFVHPDGAFYLFMKAPGGDASAFCEQAKKHELLLVPSDSFGCPGYVRIAYCVSEAMIRRSLPAFEALAKEVLR